MSVTTSITAGRFAANAYASAGDAKKARLVLRGVEKPAGDEPLDWFFIAGVHAQLGEKDQAFAWLEHALQNRDYFMTYLQVSPYMDPLRDDARFARYLHLVGPPS